jgi:hypothetical protein
MYIVAVHLRRPKIYDSICYDCSSLSHGIDVHDMRWSDITIPGAMRTQGHAASFPRTGSLVRV